MKFFRFEDPWFLILFLIIPYLVWKRKEQGTISYSSLEILQNIRAIQVGFLSTIPLVLRLFAISLFIMALARPQEGQKRTEILSMGVDIMLALDTSGSMKALDFIQNDKRDTRLTMVKDVVSKFIENRTNDRMGMVVFGSEAYTQCPLTLDQNILQSFSNITKQAKENDRVLIFFAGHGETMMLPSGGDMGYLIPVDGNLDNVYHCVYK